MTKVTLSQHFIRLQIRNLKSSIFFYNIILVSFLVLQTGDPVFAGKLITPRWINDQQNGTMGCGAYSAFVVIRSFRPDLKIGLSDIIIDLPTTTLSSAAQITDILRQYNLKVTPLKVDPSEIIPNKGTWNILLLPPSPKWPVGHWCELYHNPNGMVYICGYNYSTELGVIENNQYQKELERQKFDEILQYTDDGRLLVLNVMKSHEVSMLTWIILPLFFIAAIIWLFWLIINKRFRWV